MKVIAELSEKKCLVEMDKNELANLLNFYSTNSSGFDFRSLLNKEIKVSSIYHKYKTIRDVQSLKDWDKARTKLEQMLDALTPIESLIQSIEIPKNND